jgi:ABC-type dipeptide/oligopeptide/nickel transport system ATPase component
LVYWSEGKLRAYRKSVGVMFQESYLYLPEGMTVEEIIKEPLIAKGESLAKVEEVMDLVGIKELRNVYPFELSDGQKQKVALARALAYAEDILILDEPTSNLDPISKQEILNVLKKIKGQKTMLFITHEINLAKELCDEIYVIYKGEIVEQGPAQEIFAFPRHPYTKQLVAVGSRALEYAGKLFLEEYYPYEISGCIYHRACPLAFNECGWTADEILYDIQRLAAIFSNKKVEGATIGRDIIIYGIKKDELARLIENHPEVRSFKAIDEIKEENNGLHLVVHKLSQINAIKLNEAVVKCLLYRGTKLKL